MRYRVEKLASTCDVTVDTVRYYQGLGLLPPPQREGRVAWYGREHVERIRRIRALQRKGLTLAAVRRVLDGTLGRADQGLAAAVAAEISDAGEEELLTLDELARRSGVPAALLRALESEGIAMGRRVDGEIRYTSADVEIVRTGLRLLERGLPPMELIALARDHDAAMRPVAERAVAMFDAHVRKPIRASAASEDEAAERLVEAFREMLPAVTALVADHFRRLLLAVAEEHIERTGDPAEIAATRAESRRRIEGARPA